MVIKCPEKRDPENIRFSELFWFVPFGVSLLRNAHNRETFTAEKSTLQNMSLPRSFYGDQLSS